MGDNFNLKLMELKLIFAIIDKDYVELSRTSYIYIIYTKYIVPTQILLDIVTDIPPIDDAQEVLEMAHLGGLWAPLAPADQHQIHGIVGVFVHESLLLGQLRDAPPVPLVALLGAQHLLAVQHAGQLRAGLHAQLG